MSEQSRSDHSWNPIFATPWRRWSLADRTAVRALDLESALKKVRWQKTHALVSSGIRCAAWARDGQLSPRMDSCGVQLRHEQPRQLCLCRHAAVGPRHSHASELRVCVLGRRSAHSEPLGSCCAPVAQDEAVRQQRAVPVLLQRREHACHGCGSRLWASCTHPNACGTLYRLCTRLRRLGCVVPP